MARATDKSVGSQECFGQCCPVFAHRITLLLAMYVLVVLRRARVSCARQLSPARQRPAHVGMLFQSSSAIFTVPARTA